MGIVNLTSFWPKRRYVDHIPIVNSTDVAAGPDALMALHFAYDPDYKAPAGAFPDTGDKNDEPPY
jgi:hypothetical protein